VAKRNKGKTTKSKRRKTSDASEAKKSRIEPANPSVTDHIRENGKRKKLKGKINGKRGRRAAKEGKNMPASVETKTVEGDLIRSIPTGQRKTDQKKRKNRGCWKRGGGIIKEITKEPAKTVKGKNNGEDFKPGFLTHH